MSSDSRQTKKKMNHGYARATESAKHSGLYTQLRGLYESTCELGGDFRSEMKLFTRQAVSNTKISWSDAQQFNQSWWTDDTKMYNIFREAKTYPSPQDKQLFGPLHRHVVLIGWKHLIKCNDFTPPSTNYYTHFVLPHLSKILEESINDTLTEQIIDTLQCNDLEPDELLTGLDRWDITRFELFRPNSKPITSAHNMTKRHDTKNMIKRIVTSVFKSIDIARLRKLRCCYWRVPSLHFLCTREDADKLLDVDEELGIGYFSYQDHHWYLNKVFEKCIEQFGGLPDSYFTTPDIGYSETDRSRYFPVRENPNQDSNDDKSMCDVTTTLDAPIQTPPDVLKNQSKPVELKVESKCDLEVDGTSVYNYSTLISNHQEVKLVRVVAFLLTPTEHKQISSLDRLVQIIAQTFDQDVVMTNS